jgi:hypothetical protein
MPSPSYLLPLDATVEVPAKLASALEEIEGQFDLNTDKLKEIVEEMLRSFAQGLRELPTDETRDTFMCVPGPLPSPPPPPESLIERLVFFPSQAYDPLLPPDRSSR